MAVIAPGSVVFKIFQAMGIAEADISRIVAPTREYFEPLPVGSANISCVYRGADRNIKNIRWTEDPSDINLRLITYAPGDASSFVRMLHWVFPKEGTSTTSAGYAPYILQKWEQRDPVRRFRKGEPHTLAIGLGANRETDTMTFNVHRLLDGAGGIDEAKERLREEWISIAIADHATAIADPLNNSDPVALKDIGLELLPPPATLAHQSFTRSDRSAKPFYGVQRLLNVSFEAARLVFDGPDSLLAAEADMVPVLRQAFAQADASRLTIEAADGESTVRFGWRVNDIFWPDFLAPQ